MNKRNLNISFVKSGAGNISPRLILPISWIKEMNITEEERSVMVEFDGEKIIVKKEDK